MIEAQSPDLGDIFHALADATRRAMVRQLAGGGCTVTELSHPYDMSLAAASKHVRVLEGAGLVRREIRGRVHHCSLDRTPIAQAADWLRKCAAFRDERLDALEDMLDQDRLDQDRLDQDRLDQDRKPRDAAD